MEGGMLRKMAGVRKKPGEAIARYLPRATKSARKQYWALGHKSVEERLLERQHGFVLDSFGRADAVRRQ
eukprot:8910174-Pyramimonas_sp.AAC.1